ncbi:hypothetical protein VPH35_075136 [Triticum aestivum]
MEGVERKLHSLKLSEAEKKGVRLGKRSVSQLGAEKMQAVGKVMSDRPARVDALVNTLGRIWAPFKGIECKDLGMNKFLFTFREITGRDKALNNGPWMFNKSLLVMEKLNPTKTLDEYEFRYIPIWVRVYDIPMGWMSRESGEEIGKEIGEVLDVDVDDCGMAMGEYMRIKVRLDIRKPLMRGITIFEDDEGEDEEHEEKEKDNIIEDVDEENEKKEKGREVIFKYEYLPDFCYICGIIGHNDRTCPSKQKLGTNHEFGPWLKAVVWRKSPTDEDKSRGSQEKVGFCSNSSRGSKGSDAIS